ncbi:hypothetical protein LSUE1_G002529 [Lachnellula suecica]|uniref:Lipocalin-like domain-containing protein n=1 Tax=Lachnellula suecica TaxID=602035 RepID=A0A8T9CG64_9HELO|nr:hypothetical protein LSUE1_G002529 [Lachnellula suecica]
MVIPPQLIGAWKLLFINVTNSTSEYEPIPLGVITFTSGGYMNAMITNPDVAKPLENGTTWKNASDAQLGHIARPMVAYSGPYTVEYDGNDTYTHVDVMVSMDPSWVGTNQKRHATFEEKDGQDFMSLIPVASGTFSPSTLIWSKIAAATGT